MNDFIPINWSETIPRKLLLEKVQYAIQEFEDTTGVEVHNIEIERIKKNVIGSLWTKTVPHKWVLTLK